MGEAIYLVLAVTIKLGIPVAILFLIGYLLSRPRRRPQIAPLTDEEAEQLSDASRVLSQRALSHCLIEQDCPSIQRCPLGESETCTAYDRSYLPGWLAAKLAMREYHKQEHLYLYQTINEEQIEYAKR